MAQNVPPRMSMRRFATAITIVLLSVTVFAATVALSVYVNFVLTRREQFDFILEIARWTIIAVTMLANILVWVTMADVTLQRRRLGKTFLSGIPLLACILMFNIAATSFYWSREIWKRSR